MKRVVRLLPLFLLLGALPLAAQDIKMKVDIPFAFTAGEKVLPAGAYDVYRVNQLAWMLKTCDKGCTVSAFVVLPVGSGRETPNPRLIFSRYGNRHFLTRIWTPTQGMALPASNAEREYAARIGGPVLVAVRPK